MTELLAPNGKPSNLTPEQYKLVRTPAFKEWFGDWENDPANASKVVDENREPLVVYHGTYANINYFESTNNIYFFSQNKNDAKAFVLNHKLKPIDNNEVLIYDCFVNIIKLFNPKKLTEKEKNKLEYFVNSVQDKNELYEDYYYFKQEFEKEHLSDYEYILFLLDTIESNIVLEKQIFIDWIKQEKYDGFMVEEYDFESQNYAVFENKNIKLADGTNTTFDGKNPDIRFDNGGRIREIDVESIEVSDEIGYFNDFIFNELEEDEILEGFVIKYYHIKNIGLVNVQDDKFELGVGYIWGLEVFEEYKGKGFGKKIMEKIFILHPTQYAFRGRATKTSKGFWLNLGAEFDESDEYSFILSKDKLNYSDGGSVLLAPNKKPSNLTPEQYKLVRSESFKAWFGDWENDPANASKVVDENGEPKVVTHSTSNEDSEGNKYNYPPFNTFDGNRIFKTPNSSVIPIWFSYMGNYVVHKTIVNMPFFLNIKNLFLFNNEKHLKKLQDYMIEKYNNYDVDLEYDYNNNWEAIENENLPAYISEIGYDGYKTDSESAIAIFKSEQGKLADGTNTTFDGNNPDIRFNEGGEVIINPTEIECHKCHWHWKVKDGGDDLFICHKCYTDNSKYYKFEGLEGQKILDTISYKKGGKTIAQTPAPKKDQIKGSDKNKEGSSKDLKSAKKIELSDKTIESIKNKVDKHNEKYPNKKITIDSAKAVVRRGMGAYSSSYRPTISGGKKNSRVAWGLARLNAFLYKIVNGKSKSGKYSQDNDLIEELGYKVQKFSDGGELNDFVLYHGTGNAKKVIEALKNDSFIFHKSAGVEEGIYLTPNKKIALDYANDTQGEDIGILKIRFNETPNFKTYNNAGEQYYDGKKYSSNPKQASIEYKKDLIKNNYDGYSTGEVYVLFKEKIDLIDMNKTSVLYNYSDGGELENEELNKIKKAYDFGSEYFDGKIYGQEYKIRMNKNHPRNSNRNDDQSIHNLSLVNVQYPSAVVFREKYGKLQYQYDKIFDWEDAKEKIDDFFYEIKDRAEDYADGGDIQSYKDAMCISEFDEGGETKAKKVYVSIKLQSKRDNVINEDGIWRGDKFTRYEQKTFEELKNHQLIGIRGVSLSPNNVGDWFSYKDCLVVMNYDEFFKLNDAIKVKYDDPYQLMANDLKIFNRLYGNSEYTDEKEKKIKRRENLKKIIEKIPFYFDKAKYEYYYDDAQKRDELTRYYMALGNFGYKLVDWIIKNDYIINSPNELVEKIIQFTHLPDAESGIDYYYRYGLEKYVLTAEDIFPIVMKGLIKAGSTYTDEAEVIINNKLLNLPNKTQLFFKKEDFENSDLQDLIDKYELEKTYRVYSIKSQYIKEYQDKLLVSRTKRDISKWELGKEQLEIKKELVLNDLQKLFFDKSLDKINKILDEKYPSTYYFEWEGEETKYFRWNEVIEVQFLLNKFFEITLRDWKSVFITKKANEIYSMSFYGIYNSIEYFLRQFIEQNRDYLENINKYHNENGDYLWLYDIERAVLGVVSTTWDEENGISHNELAKKYFQMIGGELTTYYKQDEIVMPSIYKDGGETEEEFIIQELDKEYKDLYQIRGFKNIGGSDFFFSRLNIYTEQDVFIIELPNGKEIGRATLNEKENYLINIRIDENYRRKGLGLNLYNFIEYVTGKKLKPSPIKISQQAKGLWNKRNPDIRFDNGGETELYHGSEKKFKKFKINLVDRTDYGWGIYFTDSEDVAKYYARRPFDRDIIAQKIIQSKFSTEEKYLLIDTIRLNLLDLETSKKTLDKKYHPLINQIQKEVQNKSFVYEAGILNEKWLDWDKKVPVDIKRILKKIDDKYFINGETLYNYLTDKLNSQKNASLFLLDKGINGIKYLITNNGFDIDGYNYVVFDVDDIEIKSVDKYKDGGESDEPTHFWGTEAGGVLVYCSTTERYLILLRSEWVLEPNTWGIISGKLDNEENVQEAVLREAEEETGHKLGHLIPSFVFEKPNFKFHNFVSIVNEEFVPELNWENTDYKWVKLNDMPDNLHFGLKILIEKEDLRKLVQKNNTMNTNNPKDTITMDIPLLIRYSELMREDVKSDVALHEIVENLLEIKDKGVLTMDDYESVIGNVIGTEEIPEQVIQPEEEKMSEGGKLNSIKSKKGDIKISLGEDWYSDDSSVELVPVSELVKFREFDRQVKPKYNQDNSRDNINHLKYMFQKDGVKEPLIIEYSANDNAVIVIEGNHRINSAIDLGMEYLPARVVLKKYSTFTPNQLKNTMKVKGVNADQSGYISSDLKPSQVGIEGTMPIYADGGIIEGRLHSECGDDGCGRKFQVGENGHIIEAERDEAVIVADAFDDNEEYTIEGTPSEVASALNVMGGGKNFDRGAIIVKNGEELEIPELKKQAIETDVDDIIDPNSIIINRRSMADSKKYEVTGTPKQIASAINSLNGNGVVIERGAEIKEN